MYGAVPPLARTVTSLSEKQLAFVLLIKLSAVGEGSVILKVVVVVQEVNTIGKMIMYMLIS